MRENRKLLIATVVLSLVLGVFGGDSVLEQAWPQSSEELEQRVKTYESMLKRMDANENGSIEEEEAQGRGRSMLERMTQKLEIELKFPFSIDALRQGTSKGNSSKEKKRPGATDSAEGKPKVSGFGVASKQPTGRGFGKPSEGRSGSRSRSSSRRPSGDSSSAADEQADEKARPMAEDVMRRYDKNQNGQLEREEWKGMPGDPESADGNDDGVISFDELTARLGEHLRKRSEESSPDSRESSDSDTSPGKAEGSKRRKWYRFRTPTERLPEGLPEWFTGRDADADGQVSMAEYSDVWSESKVAEFERYDLNHDGILTPRECLKAEKEK